MLDQVDLPSGYVIVGWQADDEAYVHFHINQEVPGGNAGLYQKLTPKTARAIADALEKAAKRAVPEQALVSDGAVGG